jgi:hypothetical protein
MNEEPNEKKEIQEEPDQSEHMEIFSRSVRAGKRTYFFDVKTTRKNDYFLTITESKKRFHKDGRYYFEKHKIFLYKEDFEKFSDGFREVLNYIEAIKPEAADELSDEKIEKSENYTNVDFEDLESVESEKRQ